MKSQYTIKRPINHYLSSSTSQNPRIPKLTSSATIYKIPQNTPKTASSLLLSSSNIQTTILSPRFRRFKCLSNDGRAITEGGGEAEGPSFVEFITSERVKVVAMLALALALCNADRVVMSVAIVPLSLSYGWRQSFAGVVQVVYCICCKFI